MWFIAIVLLLTNGVLGENICKKPHFIVCRAPFSSQIPETANELEELCPLVLNYLDCLKNYEDTCTGKRPLYLNGQYESARNLVTDVCNNGTSIHRAVFEKIKCIKDHFLNHSDECNSYQVLNAFKDFKNTSRQQEEVSVARMKNGCVFSTYAIGCFMTTASSKCGAMAKEAINEVANRSYFLRSQCTIEALNELKGIANRLNISDAQRNILSESLRTFAWQE